MQRPMLIIVNGMPGTGKSTLVEKLSKDIGIPYIAKDQLKEFLADRLAVETREQSRTVGAIVLDMLYILMQGYTHAGYSIIAESPLFYSYARAHIQRIIQGREVCFIEVYCQTEQAVRRDRIRLRAESGIRHSAHVLAETPLHPGAPEPTEYQPLNLNNLIMVDTTIFGEKEYEQLLTQIKAIIQEG